MSAIGLENDSKIYEDTIQQIENHAWIRKLLQFLLSKILIMRRKMESKVEVQIFERMEYFVSSRSIHGYSFLQ